MPLNLYFYEIYDIILERKRIGVDRVKHEVKCRLCGQYFDAQLDGLDTVYVMPAKNYYYHKTCYDNWKKANLNEDEQWRDRIYDYLAHDLKIKYDFNANSALFYYSMDGENWTSIGKKFPLGFSTTTTFMGTRSWLFNYATKEAGGYVDFDYYHIN